MNKIEKIKKQFEQGNRWVEANTDDIKTALSELGYWFSPDDQEYDEAIQTATLALKIAEMYQNTLVTPIPEKTEPNIGEVIHE